MDEREADTYDHMWEYKSSTLPHRLPQGSKESFALSQSPFSLSCLHWDPCSFVSPSTQTPTQTCFNELLPASASCFQSSNHHHHAPSFTQQAAIQSQEAGSLSKHRLTLPHLSPKHQGHNRVQAAPEGYDNSPQSTFLQMQTYDTCSEAQMQSSLSHGSLSASSLHSNKYTGRFISAPNAVPDSSEVEVEFPEPTHKDVCIEMSVDEPELDICIMQPRKPMLHHRIASHVQQGHSLTPRGRFKDIGRSSSFNCHSPAPVADKISVPASSQQTLSKAVTPGSKTWDSKRRSHSLDSRRKKESNFLTPDAWIDSLSQENCSAASSLQPHSLFLETLSPPAREFSKSPVNPPSAAQAASCLPPTADALSPRPSSNLDSSCHFEPREEASIFTESAKCTVPYQESMTQAQGSLEAMKKAPTCHQPDNNDREPLELEAGGYDGVPESGGSYSSYASSGRGSMEPANGRLSVCQLSPTLSSSPETVEESQGSTEDKHRLQMQQDKRRKASVDENYEWDAADFCSQPGERDGLLSSLNLLKPSQCCSLPSMQFSTKALQNYTQLSLLPGHQSSCSAEPEPDTVLF